MKMERGAQFLWVTVRNAAQKAPSTLRARLIKSKKDKKKRLTPKRCDFAENYIFQLILV